MSSDDKVIQRALAILENRAMRGPRILSAREARDYLTLKLAGEECETVFAIWLDSQHAIIAMEVLARGSLRQTTVHAREVVRAAIRHNAGALILAHNHPSGSLVASKADRDLTESLREALKHVDVTLLDHIIVAGAATSSFAEGDWGSAVEP